MDTSALDVRASCLVWSRRRCAQAWPRYDAACLDLWVPYLPFGLHRVSPHAYNTALPGDYGTRMPRGLWAGLFTRGRIYKYSLRFSRRQIFDPADDEGSGLQGLYYFSSREELG